MNSHNILSAHQLGKIVAQGRKEKGLDQTAFALKIGISRKTLSDFERGEANNISLSKTLDMLLVLGQEISIKPKKIPSYQEMVAGAQEMLEAQEQRKDRKRPGPG